MLAGKRARPIDRFARAVHVRVEHEVGLHAQGVRRLHRLAQRRRVDVVERLEI